jgi:hypothetical protein
MAGKRRKKSTATEFTAAPNEAVTRGEFSASPKVEAAREVGGATAPAPPDTVPVIRGDVATMPGKLDVTHTEVKPSVSAVAVQDSEEQIREHAYHIWKHAGEPHGQHDEHWNLAEKQLRKD